MTYVSIKAKRSGETFDERVMRETAYTTTR